MKTVVLVTVEPEYFLQVFDAVFQVPDSWTVDDFLKFKSNTELKEKYLNQKYGIIGWTKEIKEYSNGQKYIIYTDTDKRIITFSDYTEWFIKNYCAPVEYEIFRCEL